MKEQNLTEEEIQRWRNKLHALRTACGCKAGMAALLLSLILCIRHFSDAGEMYSRQYQIVATLLICLAAAVAGKVIGMVWARYRHDVLRPG